jgi:L-threonylcarbamoyladenylate synthase
MILKSGRPHVPDKLATRVVDVNPNRPDPAALDTAADILLRGGLVAFATETVYGLGAIATDPAAVARIFAAKGRPALNPVIVHVAAAVQARDCVAEWPDTAERLAARFWPGPLTLVLNRSGKIPDIVTAGNDTVAVRAPAGKVAQGLIERTGRPIAAPSANRSNRLSPTRAEHVLGDLDGRIDLIIDSGPTTLGLESSVLDLTHSPPRLLRPGPIATKDLEEALGGVRMVDRVSIASSDRPLSPGQMPIHYAPRTPSFRVETCAELGALSPAEKVALLVIGEHVGRPLPPSGKQLVLDTPEQAARWLYDVLHQCDVLGLDAIVVVMPPDLPEWRAVRDRLIRATRPLAERG